MESLNFNTEDMRATALYIRLSVDKSDGCSGEPDSVSYQRQILTNWAEEHGLGDLTEYIDQGISGTNTVDRPAFQKLVADVEKGKIGTILCKDLSRIFRNYAESGRYLEDFFPSRNVRVVAVMNHYDSSKGDDSDQQALMPIIAVFNQLYSRDVSKKIKVIRKELDLEGKPVGTKPPFGYTWNPDGSGKWAPDEEAVPTVQRIFTMFANGNSMEKIANILTAEGVPTPLDYSHARGLAIGRTQIEPGHWNYNSVKAILDREEYSGSIINFRRRKVSYKDHSMVWNDKKDWSVIKNAHAPIVDRETYQKVREIRSQKMKISALGIDPSPLIGKVFCGDCGKRMRHIRGKHMRQKDYWVCTGYRYGSTSKSCTGHFVTDEKLQQIVLDDLRRVTAKARENETAFLNTCNANKKDRSSLEAEINQTEMRINAIDPVICHLYEDKVNGVISVNEFIKLNEHYKEETKILKAKLEELRDNLAGVDTEHENERINFFVAAVKYIDMPMLTKEMVDAFISSVIVSEDKAQNTRTVRIVYRCVDAMEELE